MNRREFWIQALASSALVVSGTSLLAADAEKPMAVTKKDGPKVEVVFCLDTTGSMGGLIEGAKAKIWSISNQIASGKPVPSLKIGLVAYRDRTDAYVTKTFDLTDDLDAVHANLKGFRADGGGDGPESVNQALHDSVAKMKWTDDPKVLKIIFLVGDAPPHMDYKDDVKYPETCQEAVKKGIIINTVQCGGDASTQKFWQEICTKSEGTYVQIQQDGGVVAIATPFDKDLAEINNKLATSTVVYGTRKEQAEAREKQAEAQALPAPAAADRAAFAGKSEKTASYDLLDAVRRGTVKLETLKKDELPPELQKLTVEEQKKYLEKIEKERKELQQKAVELDKQRGDFIKQKQAELGKKDGFDNQVLEMLRKQAKKHNIDY